MRRVAQGFSLMELLVVIAIAAILTGIAIPSFRSIIQSAESRSAATSFYSALTRARSEAIARNTAMSICARDVSNLTTPTCSTSSTAWRDGWIIFASSAPTVPLQVHEPIADGLTLGSVTTPFVFDATGRTAVATSFALCRGSPDSRGRSITVSRSGRVALEPYTC